jgi:ATP-dependent protease ClpP protease subunit
MSVYSDSNNIYFNTDVTTESSIELQKIINELKEKYDDLLNNKIIKSIIYKPIELHINSTAGELNQGLSLYEIICSNKYPIIIRSLIHKHIVLHQLCF